MISRRDLGRVAGVVAGAALLPKSALADDPKKESKAPAAGAEKASSPAATKKLTGAAQVEADQRVQLTIARYGARLSKADRADLARISADMQGVLDELRAYPLDWSDEPAHVFRAPRRR
jgi:hypothetical protein